jgi:hypothetical protein
MGFRGQVARQQSQPPDVAEGSKGDIAAVLIYVRFTPESRHSSAQLLCPLWATNGHCG